MSYTIRPEPHQIREARQVVEGVLESCKYILEKNEMIEISLGAAPTASPGEYGAHGAAMNSEAAQFYFKPEIDSWKDDLEKVVTKEYGKSWFYENTEAAGLVWQEILGEGFGLMFLEENSEGREPEEDVKEFEDEWQELKPSLGDFINEFNPEKISWQLKWFIGKELLKEKDLEEFIELKKSDVEEAGENLF